jgi:WD40 repeat protein
MAVSLFISYAAKDRAYVEHLAQRLAAEAGIQAWWFEAKQKAGRVYNDELIRRITAAHAVVLIVSAQSAGSASVLQEVKRAKRRNKLLIPIIIGPEVAGRVLGDLDGAVILEVDILDCINGRGGRDPLPRLLDALTPDRPSELFADALDLAPDAPPNHLAGQSLKGYLIDQRVSVTHASMVFRAVEPQVGRQVAIKLIKPAYASEPAYIRRFADEARRIARLDHPHILKLYTFWRNASGAYLVMPWMAGGSLADLRREGPLALPRAMRMFAQLASAVSYAHRHGVIHRDLKPANILRDPNDHVFLADFSIAQGTTQAATGFTLGYAPPEQHVAGTPAHPQADLYSLGVVLFELLTGEAAFPGDAYAAMLLRQRQAPPSLRERRPDLPEALDAVLRRALDPDPTARYPDIASFAAAVTQGVADAVGTHPIADPLPQLAPLPVLETNPYKGLAAFDEDDAAVFFGREQLTKQLVERLQQGGSAGRLLAVVGPSGSGKSSVVRAGLLPQLRVGALPTAPSWFMVAMIPGTQPLQSLIAALEQVAITPLHEAERQIIVTGRGLCDLIQAVLPPDPAVELLLVIDQFEEWFTQASDPDLALVLLQSLTVAICDPQSRLRVVLTLRGDWYDRPVSLPTFGPLLEAQTVWIRPLDEPALVQAIAAPAAQVGVAVEPHLLGAIIADVEDQPGALPLLQYALHDLFARRGGPRLTFATYAERGGVQGALTRKAEELYADCTPPQRDLVRQIFLRLLQLSEDGTATRRRVRQSELRDLVEAAPPLTLAATGTTIPHHGHEAPTEDAITHDAASTPDDAVPNLPARLSALRPNAQDLATILDHYGRARLLTFDYEPISREPTVEVAHEALIGGWQRLKEDWLATARDDLRVRQRLSEAAAEWQRRGRDPAYLERGGRLAPFVELVDHGGLALTEGERRFVATSRAEQERMAHDERARLAWELQQERERTAEREATNRRLRQRAVLLTLALIVALLASGAAGLLFQQANQNARNAEARRGEAAASQQEAEAQLRVAESRRLTAEATNLINAGSTEQGLLLTMEAAASDRNATNQLSLQAAVTSRPFAVTTFAAKSGKARMALFSPDGQRILLVANDNSASLWDRNENLVANLQGHKASIISATFSPDNRYIVTTSNDATARLWGYDGQVIQVLEGHTALVNSAVVSPDGTKILTASSDHTARLWSIDGQPLAILQGHTDNVQTAVFSADDASILTASSDYTARLWDQTGQLITVFQGHAHWVYSATFSPDDQYILTASADNTARVWHKDGQLRTVFAGHAGMVTQARFSPDGRFILTASSDTTARVWESNGQLLMVLQGHSGFIHTARFSPDGQSILTASADNTIRLWDSQGQVRTILQGHAEDITSAAFSPDSQHIISTSFDNTVRIWALDDPFLPRIQASVGSLTSAVFSPDGQQILTTAADGTAQIWDTIGHPLALLHGHGGSIGRASFSHDGQQIVTASDDHTARVWARDGRPLHVLQGHTDRVTSASFSPDDQYIVTTSADNTARVWQRDGALVAPLQGHTGWVVSAFFSPDSSRILTISVDTTARLWRLDGTLLTTMQGHTQPVTNATFSPDGTRILTASNDGTARLWDGDGAVVTIFQGHTDAVWQALFSPDGTTLLTSSRDRTAKVWDSTGQVLATLQGHTNDVWHAAWSPDGTRILTASADGTARLWDHTGQTLALFQGHTGPIASATFAPDGNRVLTASADGTARLWPVQAKDWLAAAACRVGRSLTEEEIRVYQVPTPLTFTYAARQCPPHYSWERPAR